MPLELNGGRQADKSRCSRFHESPPCNKCSSRTMLEQGEIATLAANFAALRDGLVTNANRVAGFDRQLSSCVPHAFIWESPVQRLFGKRPQEPYVVAWDAICGKPITTCLLLLFAGMTTNVIGR